MTAAATFAEIDAHLSARRFTEAARTLSAAAMRGDVAAIAEMAHWSIAGTIVPRDLGHARQCLRRAAQGGDEAAAQLLANFLASETGGPADWAGALDILKSLRQVGDAANQLRLIDAMPIDSAGAPTDLPPAEPLSRDPEITVFRKLLGPVECAYLIDKAKPELAQALVVDPVTRRMIPNPVRVCDNATFNLFIEDAVVSAINRRIAAATGTLYRQGEALQLLRYNPGGEYRTHSDALGGEKNQRILTVLTYLSDEYEGGETRFDRIGLRFRGEIGDALVFENALPDGRANPLALHAGAPVTKGMKWLATRWIRQSPFVFPAPQPLLASWP